MESKGHPFDPGKSHSTLVLNILFVLDFDSAATIRARVELFGGGPATHIVTEWTDAIA